MQGYSNKDTIAIHITDHCNMSCSWCYQNDIENKRIIDITVAKNAIEILEPKNVVFFGGEALLYPRMLNNIMDSYPEINFVVHTNGSLIVPEILDRVKTIALTINSFSYKYFQLQHQNSCQSQYLHFLKLLSLYKNKIVITHNILPKDNEPFFFKKAKLYDRPVDSYLYVTKEENQQYLPEFDIHYPINEINTKPKLRILCNGVVTRDMTGKTNICPLEDWKSDYHNTELPIADRCKSCEYFTKCHACNMFPHFVKYILDEISYTPHFCKFTKMFWDRHNNISESQHV